MVRCHSVIFIYSNDKVTCNIIHVAIYYIPVGLPVVNCTVASVEMRVVA